MIKKLFAILLLSFCSILIPLHAWNLKENALHTTPERNNNPIGQDKFYSHSMANISALNVKPLCFINSTPHNEHITSSNQQNKALTYLNDIDTLNHPLPIFNPLLTLLPPQPFFLDPCTPIKDTAYLWLR